MKKIILIFALFAGLFVSAQNTLISYVTTFSIDGRDFVHVLTPDNNSEIRQGVYCYPAGAIDKDMYVMQSSESTVVSVELDGDNHFTNKGYESYKVTPNTSDGISNLLNRAFLLGTNTVYELVGGEYVTSDFNIELIRCLDPTSTGDLTLRDTQTHTCDLNGGVFSFTYINSGSVRYNLNSDQNKYILTGATPSGVASITLPYVTLSTTSGNIDSFEIVDHLGASTSFVTASFCNEVLAHLTESASRYEAALVAHAASVVSTWSTSSVNGNVANSDYPGYVYNVDLSGSRYRLSVTLDGGSLEITGFAASDFNNNIVSRRGAVFFDTEDEAHDHARAIIIAHAGN